MAPRWSTGTTLSSSDVGPSAAERTLPQDAKREALRASAASGGVLRSLRHRDFRLFWIGLGLALTGFQIRRVGLGFLAYDLTGS